MFPLKLKLFEVDIYSVRPPRVVLKWEIERTVRDLRQWTIDIYRGENEHNLRKIAGPFSALTTRTYADGSVNLTHVNREIFYKLVIKHRTSNQQIESLVETWDDDLDLVGLYIVEEHNYLFEDAAGTPTLVFNRRKEGEYCPHCFDNVTKKRTKQDCNECWGTGFLGGYYDGVPAWIDFQPSAKLLQSVEFGMTEPNNTAVFMSNYPRLNPSDIIVELPSQNRWRVVTVKQTEKRRCPMLQLAELSLINRNDIEYQMPYDTVVAGQLLTLLEQRRRAREH